MIKSAISLQDLRQGIYIKAKAEPLCAHVSVEASAGMGGVARVLSLVKATPA
jgi:hypothetical protein